MVLNCGTIVVWCGDPTLVKDIVLGPDGSYPSDLTVFNDKLYFSATDEHSDGTYGRELWEYNGTDDPSLVKDINPGSINSNPQDFTALNNKLYFSAADNTHGAELWEYDGINDPTLVKDINLGVDNGILQIPRNFTPFNNKLYFGANDNTHGNELWEYDGNNEPKLVKDINPNTIVGLSNSYPKYLTVFNNKLYFGATDNKSGGTELREYDGIEVKLLANISPFGAVHPVLGEHISYLTVFNNKLYFTANDDAHGSELWVFTP